MTRNNAYVDLDGNELALAELDAAERQLVAELRQRAARNPDWNDFDNAGYKTVGEFYDQRGIKRKEVALRVPYKVLQDLSARLGIAQGCTRADDYRDELEELIARHFPSRKAFCHATGISATMLSHVLAGRKDLSLQAMSKAVARIGFRLRIVPTVQAAKAAKPAKAAQRTG